MRAAKDVIIDIFKLHESGNLDAAETAYDQLLCQIEQPDPNLLYGYGSLLVSKERFGLGINMLRAAATLAPSHVGIWTNIGVGYKHIGRDDLAIDAYEKAYKLAPNSQEVLACIAGYWVNRGEPAKVVEFARRSLAINPDEPAAHMHLALGLLEQGKFEEAWPHYETRWDTVERKKHKRPYTCPKWDGSYVGKLSIHGEQGLGDEILFMSLFRAAQARVGSVVIECATRLVPIFEESFGVKCYPNHASLIAAEGEPDAHIAMASLPIHLGLPDGKPFLERNHVFDFPKKRRIGIAWRGGILRTNHRYRTVELKDFAPIFETTDAEFVSVQYGPDEIDAEAKKCGLTTGPRDLISLQNRIASCDLVISVCQTAVHQAGAMGVPCYTLVPKRCAWRYCGESMLPWYESVRFFRQKKDGEWASVIKAIAKELKNGTAALAA